MSSTLAWCFDVAKSDHYIFVTIKLNDCEEALEESGTCSICSVFIPVGFLLSSDYYQMKSTVIQKCRCSSLYCKIELVIIKESTILKYYLNNVTKMGVQSWCVSKRNRFVWENVLEWVEMRFVLLWNDNQNSFGRWHSNFGFSSNRKWITDIGMKTVLFVEYYTSIHSLLGSR